MPLHSILTLPRTSFLVIRRRDFLIVQTVRRRGWRRYFSDFPPWSIKTSIMFHVAKPFATWLDKNAMGLISWSSFSRASITAWIITGCKTVLIASFGICPASASLSNTSPMTDLIANNANGQTAPSCPSTTGIFSALSTVFLSISTTRESIFSSDFSRGWSVIVSTFDNRNTQSPLLFSGRRAPPRRCPSQQALFQPLRLVGRYSYFVTSAPDGFHLCFSVWPQKKMLHIFIHGTCLDDTDSSLANRWTLSGYRTPVANSGFLAQVDRAVFALLLLSILTTPPFQFWVRRPDDVQRKPRLL